MQGSLSTASDSASSQLFGYSINLDERGYFEADVRDPSGHTIFEIKEGASLEEDESSFFEFGYMRGKHDLHGLESYLKEVGLMPASSQLLSLSDQERAIDEALNCALEAH